MDNEFINTYVQRLLTVNSEMTNKCVMAETRLAILEKKYNELFQQNQTLIEQHTQCINQLEDARSKSGSKPEKKSEIKPDLPSDETQF